LAIKRTEARLKAEHRIRITLHILEASSAVF